MYNWLIGHFFKRSVWRGTGRQNVRARARFRRNPVLTLFLRLVIRSLITHGKVDHSAQTIPEDVFFGLEVLLFEHHQQLYHIKYSVSNRRRLESLRRDEEVHRKSSINLRLRSQVLRASCWRIEKPLKWSIKEKGP
jgi:hypothetical protein